MSRELGGVSGLALGAHDDVYVIQNGVSGIRSYDRSGRLLRTLDDKGWPATPEVGAIAAGPRARRARESFEADGAWQEEQLAAAYERSRRTVTYLGDWHSHPRGPARPSGAAPRGRGARLRRTLGGARRGRRLALEPLALGDEDLIAVDDAAADADLLAQLADELPPDQLSAVTAHVLEDRDYSEIAADLGCSESVLRKRVSRGLRTLRVNRGVTP